jgi:prepilin-type N-terminal cleavage/methylation domain-containing protein
MTKKQFAFTLIELLVVIAIIGILSGMIVVSMGGVTQKANIAKAQVFSNSLRNSLMSNLVSEWKLDQILGSSAPYTTPDSWSGGNTGTLADTSGACSFTGTLKCPQLVTSNCLSGNCMSFDGSDDYIETTNITISENMTWSMWVKATETKAEFMLDHRASDVGVQPFYVDILGAIQFYDSGIGVSLLTSNGVFKFDSNWHFLTAVGTASSRKIYYDGVEVATVGTGITSQTAKPVNIGIRHSHDGVTKFKGSIDDIRIYNATFLNYQIKEQYYVGLNSLLNNGGITKEEYLSKINSIARNE